MNMQFNEEQLQRRSMTSATKDGFVMRLIKKTGLAKTDKQANVVALVLIGILAVITIVALSSL